MTVSRFNVATQSRRYPVVIGQFILDQIGAFIDKPPGRVFVITDDVISELYLEMLLRGLDSSEIESKSYVLQSGEVSKTLESVEIVYDFLSQNLASRSDTILALGGGVVGDIAGFVASTYKRGLRLIHVPTTLLAQVDSSLGGKNGVNLLEGKNLVGTFYQPHAIVVDVSTLRSLPLGDFVAGLAEVIKYGVTLDYELIQFLIDHKEEIIGRNLKTISKIVERSLKNKKRIVEEDETEEIGKRAILNFGHTVGHAIETCSNHSVQHGEAVSIGMVQEARLAVKKGLLDIAALESLIMVLSLFGLPTEIPDVIDINQLNEVMKQDKKVRAGLLTIPMLIELGKTELMVVSNLILNRSNGDEIQC